MKNVLDNCDSKAVKAYCKAVEATSDASLAAAIDEIGKLSEAKKNYILSIPAEQQFPLTRDKQTAAVHGKGEGGGHLFGNRTQLGEQKQTYNIPRVHHLVCLLPHERGQIIRLFTEAKKNTVGIARNTINGQRASGHGIKIHNDLRDELGPLLDRETSFTEQSSE